MTLPNSMFRGYGDNTFPIQLGDLVDGNVYADTPRDMMIGLFAAALNDELNDTWATVAAGTELAGTAPVVTRLPLEPTTQILEQWKASMPLLCVHRTGEAKYEERTLDYTHKVQQWGVHYILPPMTLDYLDRFSAVPEIFANTVSLCIRQRGHKAYESGTLQFGDGRGRLEYIKLLTHQAGQATFGTPDGALFMASALVIETGETENLDSSQYTDFDGADWSVGVGGSDGILPDVISLNTDYPDD